MRELYTANLFWLDFSQLWNRICQIKQITFCVGIWRWKSLQKKVVYIRPPWRKIPAALDRKASRKVLTSALILFQPHLCLVYKKQPWSWFGFMIKRNHLPDYDWLFRSCHESESQLRIPCQFNQARLRNVFWIDGQPFTRILVSRRLIQMAVRRKMDIDSRPKYGPMNYFTECTYHPMFQFVDWKKLFSLESKCTTNPKCKRISWNG